MQSIPRRILACATLAFGVWGCAPMRTQITPSTPHPDLVLLDGKVFTSDPGRLWAEAVAIRGERITAVGSSEEIRALAGSGTRRIDLGGRVVIPGINDAHTHAASSPRTIGLRLSDNDPEWREVLDSLATAVARIPTGQWIRGSVGPSILGDPRADRFALDSIAPAHPVILTGWTGHGSVLNTAAMRAGGIAEDEPDPAGGRWERVAGTDRLNGKHAEYAQFNLIRRRLGSDPAADTALIQGTRSFAEAAVEYGITSIQNMSFLPPERYLNLLRQADVPIRVRVIRFPITSPAGRDTEEGRELARRPAGLPLVTVSGTKWILDGTPIERGGAMHAAYADAPGAAGTLNFRADDVRAMLLESLEYDEPLLIHAGGDRAAETVLAAMESIAGVDWPSRRVRIEHGDGLAGELIARARRLGVVIVQNPAHFTLRETLALRYGPDHTFQPLRSLLEAGVPVALGSDGPLNPFLNIMWAVTHPTRPSEAITREQAVVAYTRGSAFSEFAEREKGTLAPGMLADLAVLSQDIFEVPLEALPGTRSVLTLVGGRIVHDTIEPASAAQTPAALAPASVLVNGVELHYVERGSGTPVVLVHGSLADYTYWELSDQIALLSEHHRVIAYSRRYNHPNRNSRGADHSPMVEARDLAGFLDRLGTGPVHLVGHSYGAYTALVYALEHPERVRSLVLAEPPIISWLPDIPGGAGIFEGFMAEVWRPLARAFAEGGTPAGLDFTARWYFQVPWDEVAPEWQTLFSRNADEWHALAVSAHTFPKLDYDAVRGLTVPTLLISAGKNAGGFNDLVDGHLARLLPNAERVIIPEVSHEMFLDDRTASAGAMLGFFQGGVR